MVPESRVKSPFYRDVPEMPAVSPSASPPLAGSPTHLFEKGGGAEGLGGRHSVLGHRSNPTTYTILIELQNKMTDEWKADGGFLVVVSEKWLATAKVGVGSGANPTLEWG